MPELYYRTGICVPYRGEPCRHHCWFERRGQLERSQGDPYIANILSYQYLCICESCCTTDIIITTQGPVGAQSGGPIRARAACALIIMAHGRRVPSRPEQVPGGAGHGHDAEGGLGTTGVAVGDCVGVGVGGCEVDCELWCEEPCRSVIQP